MRIVLNVSMCQFDTPIFIYYSYILVFILSIITSLVILLKDKKHPMNRNAFYFIAIIALWIANDFVQWTAYDLKINMFSARISYLANFVMLFYLYFVYHFTYTPISQTKKILLAIPLIISGLITLFSRFHFVISDFNPETCDYIPGINIYITYIISIVYAYLATRVLLKKYNDRTTSLFSKSQAKVLISAIWFFVIWNIIYEEIGKATYFSDSFIEISPHFIIGNLFFVSLIAVAIIRNNLFEFNNVLRSWFAIAIWSLIFFLMFLLLTSIHVFIICAAAYIALLIVFWKM